MSDVYELWSWSEQHQCWLAVSQGSEAEVLDGAARRTAAARKYGMWGAAFVGCKVGARPNASPAALGIDVVTEPKPDRPAPADDQAELERLRGIEQRARAIFDDPQPNNWRGAAFHILTGDIDE
jgi:hypothetical protein